MEMKVLINDSYIDLKCIHFVFVCLLHFCAFFDGERVQYDTVCLPRWLCFSVFILPSKFPGVNAYLVLEWKFWLESLIEEAEALEEEQRLRMIKNTIHIREAG